MPGDRDGWTQSCLAPIVAAVVLSVACASGPALPQKEYVPERGDENATQGDSRASDPARQGDPRHGDSRTGDSRGGDPKRGDPLSGDPTTCTLGTAEHCGTCATTCPGSDDVGTTRICTTATASGVCDILCKGEYYDLDGQLANGCEALDLPVQDSAATAVAVGLGAYTGGDGSAACDGTVTPCTLLGQIYSDNRAHDAAPTSRPLGRDDWYVVTASGTAGPHNNFGTCLGISNFPTDDTYSICVSDNGSQDPTTCASVTGAGASGCVNPATAADVGTFYIRISKSGGSNTANRYALYLEH